MHSDYTDLPYKVRIKDDITKQVMGEVIVTLVNSRYEEQRHLVEQLSVTHARLEM